MEKSRQLWEATFPRACIGTRKIIRFHIEESIAIRKTDARVNLDHFWWRGRFCGIEWKVAWFWATSRSPQPYSCITLGDITAGDEVEFSDYNATLYRRHYAYACLSKGLSRAPEAFETLVYHASCASLASLTKLSYHFSGQQLLQV